MGKPPTPAPAYAFIFHILAQRAQMLGYALALHGSMTRDLDVIAIPWTHEACSPEELVRHLTRHVGAWLAPQESSNPELKPHGRLAWQLLLHAGLYVDLSIMPRLTSELEEPWSR